MLYLCLKMWLFWLSVLTVASAQSTDPEVNLKQGRILGRHIEDGNYIAFYGIPYGDDTAYAWGRFKAPREIKPKTNADNALVAINRGIKCAQPTSEGIIGFENCLYVDVITQDLSNPKPVVVWLEGEDYEKTSNISYPLENLAKEGVVVVSVKYRLSIFGFLCLGVPEAPGNAGLKDVLLALNWIKSNIAAFGGNPNNVMLVGHGSAAALVDLITMSPSSRNLVHKAVVLSGSALAPWAMSSDPIASAQKVASKLKYTAKTGSELGKLLETTDFRVLGGAIFDGDYYNNPPLFAPCIENSELKDSLIVDSPIEILRLGKFNDIPYVAGFTDWEGTMRADQPGHDSWYFNIEHYFKRFLPADLKFKSDADEMNVTQSIRNFYFGGKKPTLLNYLKFEGDLLVLAPMTRAVVERAKTSKSPVRIFEFANKDGTNRMGLRNPEINVPGSRHGEIINYLFDYELKMKDGAARTSISSRIVAFAETGIPAPSHSVEWKPVTGDSFNLLYLSGEESQPELFVFREEPRGNINENQTMFWDKIYESRQIPLKYTPFSPSSANSLLSFAVIVFIAQIVLKFF